jgi:hypothetical protein
MTSGAGGRVGWAEVQREAAELVNSAATRGAVLRLVGSTGIRMHCDSARDAMESLERPAKDIDLICPAGDRKELRALFEERGYQVDQEMLVATEGTRYAFTRADGIEIDLFVDRLEFCHTIELRDRLGRHHQTIPIEDLLLQKLQIVEQMPSDVLDTAALLATHTLGEDDDPEAIDRRYIGDLLARDWGFHHTVVRNLAQFDSRIANNEVRGLSTGMANVVRERAAALLDAIESAPKALAWKLRAKVGERVQWWEDVPEERQHY